MSCTGGVHVLLAAVNISSRISIYTASYGLTGILQRKVFNEMRGIETMYDSVDKQTHKTVYDRNYIRSIINMLTSIQTHKVLTQIQCRQPFHARNHRSRLSPPSFCLSCRGSCLFYNTYSGKGDWDWDRYNKGFHGFLDLPRKNTEILLVTGGEAIEILNLKSRAF